MKRLYLVLIGMLFCVSAFANKPVEEEMDILLNPPQYRLFRAEGVHICWSDKVIGNQCFVSGTSYTDCMQAHFSLKAWDCCRNSPGSHSVNFIMSKCTNF
jgi:hypothetical protein